MDLFDAILNRRSIRKYENKEIPAEIIGKLLKSAMYAPSAFNYQPWQFVVINDRSILKNLKNNVISHAAMLEEAPAAILVCGDKEKDSNIDFLVQNCSAAVQNLMLAAYGSGLGSCWIGAFPMKEIMESVSKFFSLPENIVPIAIVSLGYPAETVTAEERFIPEKIHYNKW